MAMTDDDAPIGVQPKKNTTRASATVTATYDDIDLSSRFLVNGAGSSVANTAMADAVDAIIKSIQMPRKESSMVSFEFTPVALAGKTPCGVVIAMLTNHGASVTPTLTYSLLIHMGANLDLNLTRTQNVQVGNGFVELATTGGDYTIAEPIYGEELVAAIKARYPNTTLARADFVILREGTDPLATNTVFRGLVRRMASVISVINEAAFMPAIGEELRTLFGKGELSVSFERADGTHTADGEARPANVCITISKAAVRQQRTGDSAWSAVSTGETGNAAIARYYCYIEPIWVGPPTQKEIESGVAATAVGGARVTLTHMEATVPSVEMLALAPLHMAELGQGKAWVMFLLRNDVSNTELGYVLERMGTDITGVAFDGSTSEQELAEFVDKYYRGGIEVAIAIPSTGVGSSVFRYAVAADGKPNARKELLAAYDLLFANLVLDHVDPASSIFDQSVRAQHWFGTSRGKTNDLALAQTEFSLCRNLPSQNVTGSDPWQLAAMITHGNQPQVELAAFQWGCISNANVSLDTTAYTCVFSPVFVAGLRAAYTESETVELEQGEPLPMTFEISNLKTLASRTTMYNRRSSMIDGPSAVRGAQRNRGSSRRMTTGW